MLALVLTAAVVVLARPSIITLYDPWAFRQVQTVFASTAVVFMWIAGIINPSLFKGRSTAVEETNAFGVPLLSGIEVHWEQIQRRETVFFDPLADCVHAEFSSPRPPMTAADHEAARLLHLDRAITFAEEFERIIAELHRTRTPLRS